MDYPKFVIVAAVIIIILFIGFELWTAITYGNKPASEVPFWAFWILN